jgi:plasmid stability protein
MNAARNLLLTALLLAAGASQAQQGGDLQAQILYAYQTEDDNALEALARSIGHELEADPNDASLRYHVAHARYRLGLLAAAAHGPGAAAAFSDCIERLKPLTGSEVESVEALTLESACYSGLAGQRRFESTLLTARARERLATALEQDPRNPRAVFLSSLEALGRSLPGSPERRGAVARLRYAAQLFEATPATSVDTPGWGHAEAYLALGRELQASGDTLGARNWIESP